MNTRAFFSCLFFLGIAVLPSNAQTAFFIESFPVPLDEDKKDIFADKITSFEQQSIENLLCGPTAAGGRAWNIQRPGVSAWGKSFQFWKNGTITGTYYGDGYIQPRQSVKGYWSYSEGYLMITYDFYSVVSNGYYNQTIPGTDEMVLSISRYSESKITCLGIVNGYVKYAWELTR